MLAGVLGSPAAAGTPGSLRIFSNPSAAASSSMQDLVTPNIICRSSFGGSSIPCPVNPPSDVVTTSNNSNVCKDVPILVRKR
ncbi:unnamed protein product [Protopolystoma xenopodis]|uniref:Uncharacterized protein n=1 Tax=Protopolystoma xenopodis TaxID=117903 RepID=A0A3S5AI59_9PLAT|nr:unnamed protein product [Protopolystoma xenopodis]